MDGLVGSRPFDSSQLGAYCMHARIHASEHSTSLLNGLPLTPCSVNILGRFQHFKTLRHDNLVQYLDVVRGKQDRIFVIFEHHERSLCDELSLCCDLGRVYDIAYQMCTGLLYLHHNTIVHRNLALHNVLLTDQGKYCIFNVTDRGQDVDFFIGDVMHSPPEVLFGGRDAYRASGTKSDVWSLGIILLQLALNINLKDVWKNRQVSQVMMQIVKKCNLNESALPKLVESVGMARPDLQKEIPADLYSLIEKCLMISQRNRPSVQELLNDLQKFVDTDKKIRFDYPSVGYNLENKTISILDTNDFMEKLLGSVKSAKKRGWRDLPIDQVYFLWKLLGANVETILKKKGFIKTTPAILALPNVCVDDLQMFGTDVSRESAAHMSIIPLSMSNLIHRLESLPLECFLLSVQIDAKYRNVSATGHDLPLVVKERSVEYQLERMLLFQRLLLGCAVKKQLFLAECLTDIPPLYRPWAWATILDVKNSVRRKFEQIDTRSVTNTDRQIEVDIPRCHQYDELLSSPEGHVRLKRVLKAWVQTHPQYVYWQGLDSLAAPFVYLHFNDLALAYGCLSAFIPKFCHDFFLKDNAAVIQEYLAIFDLLIAFHEPELFTLMRDIMFGPELYAIPWFLTVFAHVFPLHKLLHLWDGLLCLDSVFPLCIGVAILTQLKDQLLQFGFNECILLFSDLPDVDIERCVTDSYLLYNATPKTVAYRYHAPPQEHLQTMYPLTLSDLKCACCPRISAEEVITIKATHKDAVLVLDIRTVEEYYRGSVECAVHVSDADNITEQSCAPIKQATLNRAIIVVAGSTMEQEWKVGARLVSQFIPRVCILDEGMEAVRRLKQLVIPSRYNT